MFADLFGADDDSCEVLHVDNGVGSVINHVCVSFHLFRGNS